MGDVKCFSSFGVKIKSRHYEGSFGEGAAENLATADPALKAEKLQKRRREEPTMGQCLNHGTKKNQNAGLSEIRE